MAHLPEDVLSAYLDGELPADQAAAAREHLSACAACHAKMAAFSALDATLAATPRLSCAAARPLISAQTDGQADAAEAQAAAAHLGDCAGCRADRQAWIAAETTLRALPASLPSARVDAAIAALGQKDRAPRRPATQPQRRPGFAFAGAAAVGLATVITVSGAPQLAAVFRQPQIVPIGGQVVVAGAMQQVLNSRTNTLYVLRPEVNSVAALDPFSKFQRALIPVAARPITLTVSESANRIYVIDVERRLSEIDGVSNTVVSTTTNVVTGTPTAIQVDPNTAKVVVSAISGQSSTTGGEVAVVNTQTKQLDVKSVDAAPNRVVFDPSGGRALLLGSDATTLANAATFATIDGSGKLPGGVDAAFTSDGVAIFGNEQGGARLSTHGQGKTWNLTLSGQAVALVALPNGRLAALIKKGDEGEVVVIGADGQILLTQQVGGNGRDLDYDAQQDRVAVVGSGAVEYASVSIAARPSPTESAAPATASPNPTVSVQPSPTPSTGPTSGPTQPTPSAAPSEPVVANPGLPPGAERAWGDTYRFALPDGKIPLVAASQGRRIWFVDQKRVLNSLDTASGRVFGIAHLPGGANIDEIVAGTQFVYAIDKQGVQIYVLDLGNERWYSQGLGSVRAATGFTVSADDRLWFSMGTTGQLIAFDPRRKTVEAVDTRLRSVVAIAADRANRIWYADAKRVVGYYELTSMRVSQLVLPRTGNVTALRADANNDVWLGTDTGELFQVRPWQVLLSANVKRPISGLVLSPLSGVVWYDSRSASEFTFAPVDGRVSALRSPTTVQGLAFDAAGRAWQADPKTGVFYVTLTNQP